VDIAQWENPRGDRIPRWYFRQEGFWGDVAVKKQTEKQLEHPVPAFSTEAEEAEWWYRNRKIHGEQLLAAVRSGEAETLSREKLQERIKLSKKAPATVVALRIPDADLALARRQAEQKVLPYQTYIKSILHETLADREKRKKGW
jgi:predicted DNA binding CopG/RHH family protein